MADYNKVHIASKYDSDLMEANDHAGLDPGPYHGRMSRGVKTNSRVLSAGNVDELKKLFQKLRDERASIDYLDFHAHGSPASLDLGNEHLDYADLAGFRGRGFESIFQAGAVISFMSCEIAEAKMDTEDQDGELFLAEFAQVFLHGKGGKAVGRNQPWFYRPGLLWRGADFKNAGTEIAAEVAPGAPEARLKGHFRLDENRIRQEISVFLAVLNGALAEQSKHPQQSFAQPVPRNKLEELVAAGRQQQVLTLERNKQFVQLSIARLNSTLSTFREPGKLNLRLHDANRVIEDVSFKMHVLGIPLVQILPPLLTFIRSIPIHNRYY